jgi:hypothetical protein
MDKLQTTIFTAGKTLNDVTGYTAIEKLKDQIEAQEVIIRTRRDEVRFAREAYSEAVERRLNSQREVNELLQRKNAWTGADLERFTTLIRDDHANEVGVKESSSRTESLENDLEEARSTLFRLISSRYREEQIWSDKIRRASTYGTWGLMAFNVLLFIVVQLGLEPWKRRRLVGSFEAKVEQALEKAHFEDVALKIDTMATINSAGDASEALSTTRLEQNGTVEASSYASRIVKGFEEDTDILVTAREWAITFGVTSVVGVLFGALCALASTR